MTLDNTENKDKLPLPELADDTTGQEKIYGDPPLALEIKPGSDSRAGSKQTTDSLAALSSPTDWVGSAITDAWSWLTSKTNQQNLTGKTGEQTGEGDRTGQSTDHFLTCSNVFSERSQALAQAEADSNADADLAAQYKQVRISGFQAGTLTDMAMARLQSQGETYNAVVDNNALSGWLKSTWTSAIDSVATTADKARTWVDPYSEWFLAKDTTGTTTPSSVEKIADKIKYVTETPERTKFNITQDDRLIIAKTDDGKITKIKDKSTGIETTETPDFKSIVKPDGTKEITNKKSGERVVIDQNKTHHVFDISGKEVRTLLTDGVKIEHIHDGGSIATLPDGKSIRDLTPAQAKELLLAAGGGDRYLGVLDNQGNKAVINQDGSQVREYHGGKRALVDKAGRELDIVKEMGKDGHPSWLLIANEKDATTGATNTLKVDLPDGFSFDKTSGDLLLHMQSLQQSHKHRRVMTLDGHLDCGPHIDMSQADKIKATKPDNGTIEVRPKQTIIGLPDGPKVTIDQNADGTFVINHLDGTVSRLNGITGLSDLWRSRDTKAGVSISPDTFLPDGRRQPGGVKIQDHGYTTWQGTDGSSWVDDPSGRRLFTVDPNNNITTWDGTRIGADGKVTNAQFGWDSQKSAADSCIGQVEARAGQVRSLLASLVDATSVGELAALCSELSSMAGQLRACGISDAASRCDQARGAALPLVAEGYKQLSVQSSLNSLAGFINSGLVHESMHLGPSTPAEAMAIADTVLTRHHVPHLNPFPHLERKPQDHLT